MGHGANASGWDILFLFAWFGGLGGVGLFTLTGVIALITRSRRFVLDSAKGLALSVALVAIAALYGYKF